MKKGYLIHRYKDCFGHVERSYRPVPASRLFAMRRHPGSRSGDRMIKRRDALEYGIGMVGSRRFLPHLYR